MLMYEYGHYLQSQKIGLFYMPVIGIPSFINEATGDSNTFYTEKWANNEAYRYFRSPGDHGYTAWNYDKYPVSDSSKRLPWITKSKKTKSTILTHSSKILYNFKY